MSERIRIICYTLWVAHPVLQMAIAIVMLRRGQHRRFSYFFTYIVAQIPINVVALPAYFYSNYYFHISSATNAISVALGFMVIYEAFLDVLGPDHTLRDVGILAFKWAGLLTFVVAGVIAVSTRPSDILPWEEAIITAQRCVRIIQVGMVLFLLIFARYLGMSRKQQSFGVTLGFGIFAVVELGLISSWATYRLSDGVMGVVNMVAYNSALLIWLGYALKNPAREAVPSRPQPQHWEQTLLDPLPVNSSVPVFDGTIDLDLSRSQVAPSSAIYRELSLLESELNENIKALKFTSAQISRRLGRLNILARNPPSRGENTGDP